MALRAQNTPTMGHFVQLQLHGPLLFQQMGQIEGLWEPQTRLLLISGTKFLSKSFSTSR